MKQITEDDAADIAEILGLDLHVVAETVTFGMESPPEYIYKNISGDFIDLLTSFVQDWEIRVRSLEFAGDVQREDYL